MSQHTQVDSGAVGVSNETSAVYMLNRVILIWKNYNKYF